MTTFSESPAMMVALRETTVASLMALRTTPNEPIADVVESLLPVQSLALVASLVPEPPPSLPAVHAAKHGCDVLGTRLFESSLGSLFGEVIDLMDKVAPDALERLASRRSSWARRYISRDPNGVHIASPHLPVIRTKSDWWLSANVGSDQILHALRTLCEVSGLEFGKDVIFPVN